MEQYRFVIDVFRPETIPMERLGQYLADLGRMLGETPHVHFRRIRTGSCALEYSVEDPSVQKVRSRLEQLRDGRAPQYAARAFAQINKHLAEDNASARLDRGTGKRSATVIAFPGREAPPQPTIGPIKQLGSLQGQVVRVGGTGETIPVTLVGDSTYYCHCPGKRLDLVQDLAQYIYGQSVRVEGTGTWTRNEDGQWELNAFAISAFEALDDSSLLDIRDRLRLAPASAWRDMEDPHRELHRWRHSDDEVH